MRTITLNDDDMREPCEHNNLATCGTCQRSWCDTCNPTPSARCPFEYEHDEDQEFADFLANNDIKIDPNTPLAPHGGCNWSGCTTCFPPKDEVDEAIVSDIVREATLRNQGNPQANGPCPTCGEYGGSHNDDIHRKDIDPKYLKEKGWHHGRDEMSVRVIRTVEDLTDEEYLSEKYAQGGLEAFLRGNDRRLK